MRKNALFQQSKVNDRKDSSDDKYEYSIECDVDDGELVDVYCSISPYITIFSVLMLILFTMFLFALAKSDGKIASPQEAISSYFLPIRSDYYEIRVDPVSETQITDDECQKFMNDNGFTKSLKTSAFNRSTVMQLEQEDNRGFFLPGAYGSTTFYIKPGKSNADLSIHIKYDLYGIKAADNGGLQKISAIQCTELEEREMFNEIDTLLDGHILFFQERTNGKYSGLIENGEMIYRTSDHREDLNDDGEFRVKVYWIWAEYYEQLVNPKSEGALFDNDTEQSNMIRYIKANPDEFLYMQNDLEISDDEDITNFDVLSDYYDSADKLIVENTNYFGFAVNTYAE